MYKDELMEGVIRDIIFNWMADNDVAELSLSFNGEGDSGDFEDYISITPNYPNNVYNKEVYSKANASLNDTRLVNTPPGIDKNSTMADLVRKKSIEIEEQTDHGIDWYNDDGGNGVVLWLYNTEDGGVHYDRGVRLIVRARVIEYDEHFFDIQGGEEGEV